MTLGAASFVDVRRQNQCFLRKQHVVGFNNRNLRFLKMNSLPLCSRNIASVFIIIHEKSTAEFVGT